MPKAGVITYKNNKSSFILTTSRLKLTQHLKNINFNFFMKEECQ